MDNGITITLEGVLFVLGAIITLGGAIAVISRWLAPVRNLKTQVANKADKTELEELKRQFAEIKSSQNTDHKELQKIETGVEKMCKCVFAITDHELTGNSVDRLKEAKEEMQNYLIHK